MSKGRMVVAMSGGVDSSVVAAMMVDAGWEVLGVTLQLRDCDERQGSKSCCAPDAITGARAVAGQLGIRHVVLDCRDRFKEKVLQHAWDEYQRGRTPSPCLYCNRDIKFGMLWEYAERLGSTRIATGHYARLEHTPEGPALYRGEDRAKDQSYFLSYLTKAQLERLELPLGSITKPEVREWARRLGLATADKHESQDACLALDGHTLPESLRLRFEAPSRTGSFVDTHGKVLGPHEGFHRYTIGQRRGLGIALGQRAHVVALNPEDGSVVLSTDDRDLLSHGLEATDIHWFGPVPERCDAQIRSRHRAAPCRVKAREDGTAVVHFDAPQQAVAPGQAVAFYDGERLLGGGWIARGFGA